MNPKETNPMSASGMSDAGASSFGSPSSPVDFTGGTGSTSGSAGASGLSMADSLASAQDNLTSAGLAAGTADTGAIGLNQLGASDPSASMARPTEPLVPAEPVPGSIGSVTSVPPLKSATDTAGTAETGFGTSGATGMSGAAGAGTMSTGAAGTSGAAGASAQPYYNPFAQTGAAKPVAPMGASGTPSAASSMAGTPASSAAVPPTLQPAAEKFSAKGQGAGKPSNILVIILGGLCALFLVAAIIFAVLWQQAANSKEIVYLPPVSDGTQKPEVVKQELTCTQQADLGGLEVLQNLVGFDRTVVANFDDENLSKISMRNAYTFTDNAAAEAARGHFDEQINQINGVALELGVPALGTQIDIVDNVLNYNLDGTADKLMGDYAAQFLLNVNEEGKVQSTLNEVQEGYQTAGFVCSLTQ